MDDVFIDAVEITAPILSLVSILIITSYVHKEELRKKGSARAKILSNGIRSSKIN